MNEKIQDVFLEIFGNERLISKFIEIDDIDEMYQFCLKIKGGYTRNEFVDFLSEYAEFCDSLTPDIDELEEIDDDRIENIAGGFNASQKWMAGALAALSVFTSSGVTHAADVGSKTGNKKYVSVGVNNDEYYERFVKEKSKEESKIKRKFKKIYKWVKNHKTQIALGGVVVAAAVAALAGFAVFAGFSIKEYNDNKTADKNMKNFSTGETFQVTKYDEKTGKLYLVDATDSKNKKITIKDYKYSKHDGLSESLVKNMKEEEFIPIAEDLARDRIKVNKDRANGKISAKRAAEIKKNIESVENMINKRFKDESFINSLGKKLGIIGTVGSGVVGVGSLVLQKADGIFSWASSFAKRLTNIINAAQTINYLRNIVNSVISKSKPTHKFDAAKRREWLQEELEKVKGQPEAVKETISLFDRIVASRELTDLGANGKDGSRRAVKNRPNFVIFNGTAGTGKSMCAEILAKALSPSGEFSKVISSSMEKLSEKTNRSGDILSTLFYVPQHFFVPMEDIKTPGNYIRNNPRGVVIIDEYDKVSTEYCSNNSTVVDTPDGPKYCNPFDEAFRRIYEDPLYSTSGGTDLDLSEVTFILTSNEYSTMFGKEYDPREGPLNDKTRTSYYGHDGSFLDRIGGNNVITFNALGKDAYIEIGRNMLDRSIKFFGQKSLGQFGFKVSEGIYESMARFIEKQTLLYKKESNTIGEVGKDDDQKSSARGFEKLFNKLDATIQITAKNVKATIEERLAEKRNKRRVSIDPPKYLDFKLDFNEETGEFEVEIARYGSYTRYLAELGDIDLNELREEIKANSSKKTENAVVPESKSEETVDNKEEQKQENKNDSSVEVTKPEEEKNVQEQVKPVDEEKSQEVKSGEPEEENNEEQKSPADEENKTEEK